jgi:hypothetical protein
MLNTAKNSKCLSKCCGNFYVPFVNTGWLGFLGVWKPFFRGSSVDESLGNTLLGTLGYLSFAWNTQHLQECRISYQHNYVHMVLLSWKPHQTNFGTEELVKYFDFQNLHISVGHWKLFWSGCNLKQMRQQKLTLQRRKVAVFKSYRTVSTTVVSKLVS